MHLLKAYKLTFYFVTVYTHRIMNEDIPSMKSTTIEYNVDCNITINTMIEGIPCCTHRVWQKCVNNSTVMNGLNIRRLTYSTKGGNCRLLDFDVYVCLEFLLLLLLVLCTIV